MMLLLQEFAFSLLSGTGDCDLQSRLLNKKITPTHPKKYANQQMYKLQHRVGKKHEKSKATWLLQKILTIEHKISKILDGDFQNLLVKMIKDLRVHINKEVNSVCDFYRGKSLQNKI